MFIDCVLVPNNHQLIINTFLTCKEMVLPEHFSTMGTFLLNELFYKIAIVVVKVNRLLFKEMYLY